MSFFRQCIWLLSGMLVLMALQGVHGLWRARDLGVTSSNIASRASLATQSRILWDEFRSADDEFRRAMAMTDVGAGDQARNSVQARIARMEAVRSGRTRQPVGPMETFGFAALVAQRADRACRLR